jgi:stage IV sporulation protein FB
MLSNNNSGLSVSAGFCLLVLWFGHVNGWYLLLMILGAAAVHELGHLCVLLLFRRKVRALRIGMFGAVLDVDCRNLSYGKELLAVMAGPAMNLLCAGWITRYGSGNELMTGIHLILGGFNLLPIRPLDGGSGTELILTWLLGPFLGERLICWISAVTSVLLAGGILTMICASGGSLWLVPAMVGLLGIAMQEWFGKQ